MPRVIGIISGKGGVGKTIVAINLAASLCKYYKKRVLILDANITTPHVGLYLGLYSTPVTLNDVLKGHVEIEKAIYEHSSGIHAMPSSLRYEDMKDVDWRVVKDKTSEVFERYDIIILDSSPGFNRESLITLGVCNEAVFVTNPIVHSAADLIKCRDISRELNVRPLGIALNMVRNKKYEISEREVEELVELNVLCSIPYDDRVMESIVKKRLAIELSQKIDREILKISKHIAGSEVPFKGEGFFSRLFALLK
jgi:flagellar biosynthesis protein FlhG